VIQDDSCRVKVAKQRELKTEPLKSIDKDVAGKIQSVSILSETIAQLKACGKRIVHCHGVFDLIHLGHIRHLNLAKSEGDVLIVTITADKYVRKGPGRPLFNEHLRAEALASLAVTDYVAIVDAPTAVECIGAIKPDVYAKGPDYKKMDQDVTGEIYSEQKAVDDAGGELIVTEDITFSSSSLINNHFDVHPPETLKYLKRIREKYSSASIADSLESLTALKTLVMGDAIVDQYHYCLPMGKSSKEPLVANRYVSEEMFPGGALATANNIAAVCGDIDLLTMLGENKSHESFIRERLDDRINPIFFYREESQTIVKRRYVSHGVSRKLFEICYMEDDPIPETNERDILTYLDANIRNYDLVVVNDFGHGLLTEKIIEKISSEARYLALNVQTNSANIGFNLVTKYPRANCVCIDEGELRFAAHDKYGDLHDHMERVYEQLKCGHMIATRGEKGSLCYSESEGFCETPAFANHVVDAIGAGDAFFAFVAPCFAVGLDQEVVSFVGNAVGSLAVQIVCNRAPVNLIDLKKYMTRLLK